MKGIKKNNVWQLLRSGFSDDPHLGAEKKSCGDSKFSSPRWESTDSPIRWRWIAATDQAQTPSGQIYHMAAGMGSSIHPPFSFIPLPPICKKRDLSSKRNHFRSFLPGEMLNLACFNTTKYLWDRVTLRVDTGYSSSFPAFPSFSAAECFSSMLPMGKEVIRGWSEKWGTNIMSTLNVRHLSTLVLDIWKRRGRCRLIPYKRSQKISLGISCILFLKSLNKSSCSSSIFKFHKIILFFSENSLKVKGMNKLIMQEEINMHTFW